MVNDVTNDSDIYVFIIRKMISLVIHMGNEGGEHYVLDTLHNAFVLHSKPPSYLHKSPNRHFSLLSFTDSLTCL